MFNCVVIATDLDGGPDRAMPIGGGLARRGRLPVEVLSVVAPHRDLTDAESRRPSSDLAPNTRWTFIAGDDVAVAIVEHAQGRDGALLVMAVSATGLVSRSRDSLGARVLDGMRQPLLVLGPVVADGASLDSTTLVMCTDRTHDSRVALPVIESWQRTFGGGRPWVVEVIPSSGWPADTIDDAAERAHAEEVAGVLADQGVDAATRVLHGGDPVDALLEFAAAIDDSVFVVTSDRWAGGRSHWYSTTRRLVQRSPRPVLVVPADLAGR